MSKADILKIAEKIEPKPSGSQMLLLDLPVELHEKILSYLTFDEIARNRQVCKAFNVTCQHLLKTGFLSVEKYHGQCLRNVKAQLPRRESERRTHPLARHCEILNSIESRLSLLSMTFIKYIDLNLCSFIPGKVIDEIYRVLRLVKITAYPPRTHEVLQELRDISSMAIEHFDETIAPILRQKMATFSPSSLTAASSSNYLTTVPFPSLRKLPKDFQNKLVYLHNEHKKNCTDIKICKKDTRDCKIKMLGYKKKIQDQEKSIAELSQIISDQNTKILEQEGRLNELSRKFVEYEQRFADLMVKLSPLEESDKRVEKDEAGVSDLANADVKVTPEVSGDASRSPRTVADRRKLEANESEGVESSKRRRL